MTLLPSPPVSSTTPEAQEGAHAQGTEKVRALPGPARERSFAGHSAIAVENIDRSLAFYASLGFEPLWRDSDWAFLRSPVGWGVALLGP
jgi:hypothetical protein